MTTTVRIEPSARRIRAVAGGRTIADTIEARLVFVEGRHPEYFIPASDLASDLSRPRDHTPAPAPLGLAVDRLTTDTHETIGREYLTGIAAGLVQLDADHVEAWFEEDERLTTHPRDPYRRLDVLASSRLVEITIEGVVLAASTRPHLVNETGLPARWYLPSDDVDWSLLSESQTTSHCQYKGDARWWNVQLPDHAALVDVAWGYATPIAEAPKLSGLVAFYAEHEAVETIVDGARQPKPQFDPSWLSPSLHLENTVVVAAA